MRTSGGKGGGTEGSPTPQGRFLTCFFLSARSLSVYWGCRLSWAVRNAAIVDTSVFADGHIFVSIKLGALNAMATAVELHQPEIRRAVREEMLSVVLQ